MKIQDLKLKKSLFNDKRPSRSKVGTIKIEPKPNTCKNDQSVNFFDYSNNSSFMTDRNEYNQDKLTKSSLEIKVQKTLRNQSQLKKQIKNSEESKQKTIKKQDSSTINVANM